MVKRQRDLESGLPSFILQRLDNKTIWVLGLLGVLVQKDDVLLALGGSNRGHGHSLRSRILVERPTLVGRQKREVFIRQCLVSVGLDLSERGLLSGFGDLVEDGLRFVVGLAIN